MRTILILDPCLVGVITSRQLSAYRRRRKVSDYGYVCGSSQRSSYTGPIGYRLSFVGILVDCK